MIASLHRPAESAEWLGEHTQYAERVIAFRARRLLRHPAFRDDDCRDLEQEMAFDLWQRFSCFDASRSCETTFIQRIVERKAISLVRSRTAGKRSGRLAQPLLTDPTAPPSETDLYRDVQQLVGSLPPGLQALCVQLSKTSAREISRRSGLSRRQLDKKVAELRRRFEQAGLREYLPGEGGEP